MADRYRIRHHFDELWVPGGYTIVIDMEEKIAGISLCSDKDQFGRKKGVALAKERIVTAISSRPSDCSSALGAIVAPRVQGRQAWLLREAIARATTLVLKFMPELQAVMLAYSFPEEKPKEKEEEQLHLPYPQQELEAGSD